MFCSKCGKEIQTGAKFCGNCGSPVWQAQSAPVNDASVTKMPTGNAPVANIPMPNVPQAAASAKKQGMPKAVKIIIIVAAAVIVSAALAVCIFMFVLKNDNMQLQRQLRLGQKYLKELEYDQAIASFETALKIDPKCVDAHLGLADAYEGKGDFVNAAVTLIKATDKLDDERLIEAEKDFMRRHADAYNEALKKLGKATEDVPDDEGDDEDEPEEIAPEEAEAPMDEVFVRKIDEIKAASQNGGIKLEKVYVSPCAYREDSDWGYEMIMPADLPDSGFVSYRMADLDLDGDDELVTMEFDEQRYFIVSVYEKEGDRAAMACQEWFESNFPEAQLFSWEFGVCARQDAAYLTVSIDEVFNLNADGSFRTMHVLRYDGSKLNYVISEDSFGDYYEDPDADTIFEEKRRKFRDAGFTATAESMEPYDNYKFNENDGIDWLLCVYASHSCFFDPNWDFGENYDVNTGRYIDCGEQWSIFSQSVDAESRITNMN